MRQVLPLEKAPQFLEDFWYAGTDAIKAGFGLCFNSDYGTAADDDQSRMRRVETPSATNHMWFAGVTIKSYAAKATGQWVTLAKPGSVCKAAVGANTVVATTRLTCSCGTADAGRFSRAGFAGAGTLTALETNASVVKESNDLGGAALDTAGTTLTDGSATFETNDVAVGDKVVIFVGEDDDTNAVTAAEYTVSSITSETVLVLTAAASDGGTMQCSYYVMDGNPRVLAVLDGHPDGHGPQSGLQRTIQVTSPGSANSVALTAGCYNYLGGGITLATADATDTTLVADSAAHPIGTLTGIELLGALTTNDALITCTGTQGGVAITTLEFDADGDKAELRWTGVDFELLYSTGAITRSNMTPGSGIAGTADACAGSVRKIGDLFKTEIFIDLTGLNSGTSAGDIIGKTTTANCHIGQITAAINGTIVYGQITCLETPAGGDPDVDFYGSADKATGVQDAAITTVDGEEQLLNNGDWTGAPATPIAMTALPDADGYLYMADGGGTAAAYTAGQFLIEMWGTA